MATNPFVGSTTLAESTHQRSLVFKALAKRIAGKLRCGLPGVIRAFDPVKQYATVRLAVTENLIQATGGVLKTKLPDLQDVLVLFPGDANWCLTFPTLVGCECYVCFADMCINAWATHGFKANGDPQDQELQRRHDLSDGFAILAPRSQPNKIPSYSTTAVELRNMTGSTKIALDAINIALSSGNIGLFGNLHGNQIPVPGTAPSTASIPIILNGVPYYIRLSSAP